MGINIATEVLKTPPSSESRLYQAIVVQAFEDCLYTLGGKNEAYNKKEAHEWFMGKERIDQIRYKLKLKDKKKK
jgi:hypothetical protein